MGLTRLFDISRRSLGIYQRALDITSHNISNANNTAYSRQIVNISAEKPEMRADGVWGTGIKMDNVVRARNGLVDNQIRNYNQNYGNFSKRNLIIGQVETIFSEPSDLGISTLMTNFFNSFKELAVTPSSQQYRNNVVRSAENLATKFQNIYDGINQARSDIKAEAQETVDKLNNYMQQLNEYNKQIFEAQVVNLEASDMMDKRDDLLAELSKIANINVAYDDQGAANVTVGGLFAADRFNYSQFEVQEENGKLYIANKGAGNVRMTLNNGELYALTDLYSEKLPNIQANMDTLANSIVAEVNAVHSTGYTMNGLTNQNFFEGYGNGSLKINSTILANTNAIAASANTTTGNGDIALKLGDLLQKKTISGKTFNEYYSETVSDVGNQKSQSKDLMDSNQLVLEQLEMQKSSYSGVSVDEEMTNILKFQRSYEASAKLIKVADEMLQTILGMV